MYIRMYVRINVCMFMLAKQTNAQGDRPGITRNIQEIKLDKGIVLLDCPGVVFDVGEASTADAVLRNCIPIDKVFTCISICVYVCV